jgi:hypothetical protein
VVSLASQLFRDLEKEVGRWRDRPQQIAKRPKTLFPSADRFIQRHIYLAADIDLLAFNRIERTEHVFAGQPVNFVIIRH